MWLPRPSRRLREALKRLIDVSVASLGLLLLSPVFLLLPPLEEEYEHFEPWHRLKLSVRPGMTCLWQVGGRSEMRDFDRLRAQGARGALSGARR